MNNPWPDYVPTQLEPWEVQERTAEGRPFMWIPEFGFVLDDGTPEFKRLVAWLTGCSDE